MELTSRLSSSLHGDMETPPNLKFLPSHLEGLKLWTKFNSGITVTGAGVSQWDDVSGNGNHLKQATDTNRPSLEADGSILFDGADNFLKATSFTLVQPETIYLLMDAVSWSDGDRIFDGNTSNTGGMLQSGGTPNILAWAGAAGAVSSELTLGSYHVLCNVFDHDNSLNTLQIDKNTPSTDTAFGTNDMSGFSLATIGNGGSYANIQVKEVLVYSTAHDAATRAKVIAYLSNVGGL